MVRLETLISRALKRTNNDRYLLTVIVSKRAEELNKGATPLVKSSELKKDKFADIAIMEIADGHLELDEYIKAAKA